jgi:hypothetical protein
LTEPKAQLELRSLGEADVVLIVEVVSAISLVMGAIMSSLQPRTSAFSDLALWPLLAASSR